MARKKPKVKPDHFTEVATSLENIGNSLLLHAESVGRYGKAIPATTLTYIENCSYHVIWALDDLKEALNQSGEPADE